jgi:hypothetical protein
MAQLQEELDFEVKKEIWNIYELEDSSILRFKGVLIKVMRDLRTPPTPAGAPAGAKTIGVGLSFQNIMSIKSPLPLKGKPSGPISPEEMKSLNKTEVIFNPFYEDWNIYILRDGTEIRVKFNISKIEKIEGKFDAFGNPIYRVNSVPAITAYPPKSSLP